MRNKFVVLASMFMLFVLLSAQVHATVLITGATEVADPVDYADDIVFTVDVNDLGYNKVLAKGKIKNKYKIKAESFSKLAVKKIEESGGQILNDTSK